MGKIATTWKLMKESWQVLMRDKHLVWFPIASSLACFLVFLTFVGPFIGVEVIGFLGNRGLSQTLAYVVLFLYYVCNFLIAYFFNAALIDYVVTRARGGEPTLGGSLKVALRHLPQIAVWALVSATVGVVLKAISSRAGVLAQVVIAIVGVGWTFLTYFVVPFIVLERKDAFGAIGASKDLLVKTWGQQLISNVSYGLIGFFLTLPAIVLLVATVIGAIASGVAGSWGATGAWGTLAFVAFLYILAVGIVISTLDAIFAAALFLHVRTGEAPPEFSAETLGNAIRGASVPGRPAFPPAT